MFYVFNMILWYLIVFVYQLSNSQVTISRCQFTGFLLYLIGNHSATAIRMMESLSRNRLRNPVYACCKNKTYEDYTDNGNYK